MTRYTYFKLVQVHYTNIKAVGAWYNKLSNNELSLAKTADVFYSHLEMSKLEELKGQHINNLLINL